MTDTRPPLPPGWRYLEEGEKVQEGDWCLLRSDSSNWVPSINWKKFKGQQGYGCLYIRRTDEPTGWIKCSERMPTEADGDVNGQVFWGTRERTWLGSWDQNGINNASACNYSWRPTGIDTLPESEPPKRLHWSGVHDIAANGKNYETDSISVHQVFASDPDIDACKELIKWIETQIGVEEISGCLLSVTKLRKLIAKCKRHEETHDDAARWIERLEGQ